MTTSSPGLEVEAVLRDLQRLARVARDRQLLGVAAELRRQPASRRLDVPLDQPAVIDRHLIREIQVALVRLVDDGRAGTVVAVVQVDQRAIEHERGLDVAPVELVLRDLVRRAVAQGARRLATAQCVAAKGKCASARGTDPKE